MKKVKDESYCIRALKEAQEKFFKGRGDEDISYGIKVEEDKDKMIITAYAEVGYTTLEKMCDVLNNTLDQYKGGPNANYYFEPDYPGVATCYIWKEKEVEDSKFKDKYPYDNDRDDEYFVVTLENMSKEDAKSYSRCYGLRAKPARTGGYQLAGDEDSVREMLEDYIGRYDKIGKIMNEGYYIYSDDFKDSKSCYPSCDKKVKDNYNHFHEEKDDKWSVVFLPKDFDDQELFNSIANKYNCKFEHHKTPQVNRVIFYGEPENVFKASKELNSKINSKVNDSKKVKDSGYDNLDTKTIKRAISYINLIAKNNTMPIDRILEDLKWSFPMLTVDNVKEMYESVMGVRLDSSIIKKAGFKDSKGCTNCKDSDYEFEYIDSYNNKDTFYNFKDLKEVVEDSEKVAKKENLYFSWSVRVWSSNGNASFDSADGDTLKDVENFIKDASKSKKVKDSQEDNYKALEEYLEWEGIIGYSFNIEYIWENNEAKIDEEWETFDNPYDALDAYFKWEGIIGYTDAIYDILKNGEDSVYYTAMLREKQSYEED